MAFSVDLLMVPDRPVTVHGNEVHEYHQDSIMAPKDLQVPRCSS